MLITKPKYDIPMYNVKELRILSYDPCINTATSSAVKIIETNLSIHNETQEIMDHQSRIIEADSWEQYVDYYINHWKYWDKPEEFKCLTNLIGATLPRYANVCNLEYDNYHLSCSVFNPDGMETKKLAYLINHEQEDKIYG